MKTCAVCGATDLELEVTTYKVPVSNPYGPKKITPVHICICCDAWGMATEEKLAELAGE